MSMPRLNRAMELTCRISDEYAESIENKLSELSDIDTSIASLVESVSQANWNSPSMNSAMMPYVALLGYQNTAITKDDFVTLLLYWVARKQYGDKLEILTPATPEYERKLRANLTLDPGMLAVKKFELLLSNKTDFQIRHAYYLSDKSMAQFMQASAKLPRLQQAIFCVRESIPTMPSLDQSTKLIDVLSGSNINFSALTRTVDIKNKLFLIMPDKVDILRFIPSLGLMQIYLQTKFAEEAISINPVIGVSSLQQIKTNGLTHSRDMAFVFPGVKLPDYADHFLALGDDFRVHDFYHCFAASAVPREHQVLMIGLADIIKKHLSKKQALITRLLSHLPFGGEPNCMKLIFQYLYQEDKRTLNRVADALVDMEHPYYRAAYCSILPLEKKPNLDAVFIKSLVEALIKPALLNLDLNKRKHGFYREYILPELVIRVGLLNEIVQYLSSVSPQIYHYLVKSDVLGELIKESKTSLIATKQSDPANANYAEMKVNLAQELQRAVKHVAANPAVFFKQNPSSASQPLSDRAAPSAVRRTP